MSTNTAFDRQTATESLIEWVEEAEEAARDIRRWCGATVAEAYQGVANFWKAPHTLRKAKLDELREALQAALDLLATVEEENRRTE